MVLEMDIGIICGCLSGVKPVLAAIFPTLFSSSYKTRSGATRPTYGMRTGRNTHGESFAFQPLSDISSNNKAQVRTLEHAFSVKDLKTADNEGQHNFAWASSDGQMGADSGIPANAIGINQVVLVEEEEVGTITPRSEVQKRLSDAGSEEWIMGGGPRPRPI
jgi:hypothetical protein